MTKHRDMCSKANCSECDPEIPARRTAKLAEELFYKQCIEEGKKTSQKRWAETAPILRCKLCDATVKNPRITTDNNRRRQNKNKWFLKKTEIVTGEKENIIEMRKIHICAMCMTDKWEILEPSKWSSAVIKTEQLSSLSSRVWRKKLDGEISAYHSEADKHLQIAENHFDRLNYTPECNRKRSLDLMEKRQRNHLKTITDRENLFNWKIPK